MKTPKATDATPADKAPASTPADLPTHGGLYEHDPAARTMRAVEGGPPPEAGGNTGATTGEPA